MNLQEIEISLSAHLAQFEEKGALMLHISIPESKIDNRNPNAFLLKVSGMPQNVTSSAFIEVSESIPESFLAGWADYQAGRVVDMDRILGEEPPPA